ncbi:MAG: hypothetical protein ACYCW6_10375 [Candidatus Xenobia bacterium]
MSIYLTLSFLASWLGLKGNDPGLSGVLYLLIAWPAAGILAGLCGRYIGRLLSSLFTLRIL